MRLPDELMKELKQEAERKGIS
ncbi:hypothetical protein [Paenibacillus popilliae]